MVSFKKTDKEKQTITRAFLWVGVVILLISMWHVFSISGQVPDANSVNYENIVQSHIMTFKLKFAAGLFALGSIASYGLTYAITHSPLGKWMFEWSASKDDSNSKAAKILSLGLVFAGSIVGVFTLLSTILGK